MIKYFIFAGEASGDLHGSALMNALRNDGLSRFSGVGGPLMRAQGLIGDLITEDFQVMGFSDVLKALPRLCKYFYRVLRDILYTAPHAVILIDYPGFNLRLAKALRKRGFKGKIIQYICPTVWAHGKKRIKTMVDTLDLLLTIYPFEKACFSNTNLEVKYVGSPLVEHLKKWKFDASAGLPSGEFVALFPGSRPSEIKHHFPLMLEAATEFKKKFPEIKFACSYVDLERLSEMQVGLKQSAFQIDKDFYFVSTKYRYELMQNCTAAIAKSGTVTLELALLKKPALVLYALSRLNHFAAKYLLRLKLPHYCIVNILGNSEIYPEIIGTNLCGSMIGEAFRELYESEDRLRSIENECQKIINLLGDHQTGQNAANAVLELFK